MEKVSYYDIYSYSYEIYVLLSDNCSNFKTSVILATMTIVIDFNNRNI